jgi:putative NIF3 family GTP cyclohydrolase 1 type 2
MSAQREGADVLITGEVKQHVAVEATESGMGLIAAGHYATEHPGSGALRDRMAEAMPEIEWHLFTPEPGESGRPF